VNTLNKIKEVRNKLGLSIYDVADKTGISPSYISNLENDFRSNPSREVMEKISSALGENIMTIFFPDEK
jgi:transcriptional regulator with XRE-family HTH domain